MHPIIDKQIKNVGNYLGSLKNQDIIIFTHCDADGLIAGESLREFLAKNNSCKMYMITGIHQEVAEYIKTLHNKILIFIDIGSSRLELLRDYVPPSSTVVIIDHHKKDLKEVPERFKPYYLNAFGYVADEKICSSILSYCILKSMNAPISKTLARMFLIGMIGDRCDINTPAVQELISLAKDTIKIKEKQIIYPLDHPEFKYYQSINMGIAVLLRYVQEGLLLFPSDIKEFNLIFNHLNKFLLQKYAQYNLKNLGEHSTYGTVVSKLNSSQIDELNLQLLTTVRESLLKVIMENIPAEYKKEYQATLESFKLRIEIWGRYPVGDKHLAVLGAAISKVFTKVPFEKTPEWLPVLKQYFNTGDSQVILSKIREIQILEAMQFENALRSILDKINSLIVTAGNFVYIELPETEFNWDSKAISHFAYVLAAPNTDIALNYLKRALIPGKITIRNIPHIIKIIQYIRDIIGVNKYIVVGAPIRTETEHGVIVKRKRFSITCTPLMKLNIKNKLQPKVGEIINLLIREVGLSGISGGGHSVVGGLNVYNPNIDVLSKLVYCYNKLQQKLQSENTLRNICHKLGIRNIHIYYWILKVYDSPDLADLLHHISEGIKPTASLVQKRLGGEALLMYPTIQDIPKYILNVFKTSRLRTFPLPSTPFDPYYYCQRLEQLGLLDSYVIPNLPYKFLIITPKGKNLLQYLNYSAEIIEDFYGATI